MPSKVTKWLHPDDAHRMLEDGEGVRMPLFLADHAIQEGIGSIVRDMAAVGASKTAHQSMVDSLGSAWQGADAAPVQRADREAALTASIAAAEATGQRVADSRQDAAAAHLAFVEHLNSAWRGQ